MRLTEKKDNGHWSLKGVSWDELKPGALLTEKVWQKLYGALWKLKDYEDTGVDPDEIGNATPIPCRMDPGDRTAARDWKTCVNCIFQFYGSDYW